MDDKKKKNIINKRFSRNTKTDTISMNRTGNKIADISLHLDCMNSSPKSVTPFSLPRRFDYHIAGCNSRISLFGLFEYNIASTYW